jgi:hypothetical protein
LISVVVEEIAAVMRVICWPILGIAAVFSTRFEEGERVARVASAVIGQSTVWQRLWENKGGVLIAPV